MNNSNYKEGIINYSLAMLMAKKMLDLGIIETDDFTKIESKVAAKYCIKTCSIYRLDNLIKNTLDGNITH